VKSYLILNLLVTLGFCAISFASTQKSTKSLLIKNVTIISPDQMDRSQSANVLIEGDRIKDISRKVLSEGDTATIYDGKGLFLIPGLIDSHIHLSETLGMRGDQAKKHPKLTRAFFNQLPKSYLYFGYTTLIDPNASLSAIDKLKKAAIHPDIFHCGRALVLANGYGMVFEPPLNFASKAIRIFSMTYVKAVKFLLSIDQRIIRQKPRYREYMRMVVGA